MALSVAEKKHREKKGQTGEPETAPFSDTGRQEEILHPEASKLELFGKEIKLHPLPARWSLKFVGFSARVIGAAQESRGVSPALRIGGALAEDFADEFLRYVARATFRPDAIVPEDQIDRLAREMQGKLDASCFIPLSRVFDALFKQNKTMDALNGATGEKN